MSLKEGRVTVKQIVFVDYENLQPTEEEMRGLIEDTTEVYLLHGVLQHVLSAFWVDIAFELGRERLHRIQLSSSAPNALDMFVPYYIGTMIAQSEPMSFKILSNDKGYDPLIDHLREQSVVIERLRRDLKTGDLQNFEPELEIDLAELVDKVIERIKLPNRPKKTVGLMNMVQSVLKSCGEPGIKLTDVRAELEREEWVHIDQDNVIYSNKLLVAAGLSTTSNEYELVETRLLAIEARHRPSKLPALQNAIASWTKDEPRKFTDSIIATLVKEGRIFLSEENSSVTYLL